MAQVQRRAEERGGGEQERRQPARSDWLPGLDEIDRRRQDGRRFSIKRRPKTQKTGSVLWLS